MINLFSEQQMQRISNTVAELNTEQLAWLGGYFSALSQQPQIQSSLQLTGSAVSAETRRATVLYGSQTGNSKTLAEKLYVALRELGVDVQLKNMLDYRTAQLKKEQQLFIVVSTHGNGEPPDEALGFFKFLNSDRAPLLDKLNYSVLALGDSSYEEYCQAGVDLDQRLQALGAHPLHPRSDCDVDFAETASQWQQGILKKIEHDQHAPLAAVDPASGQSLTEYSATHPFNAEVISAIELTTDESEKNVYHIELSLDGSGLTYLPGDILGVQVNNDPALVTALIEAAGLNADAEVNIKSQSYSLHQALLEKLEITSVTSKQLKAFVELSASGVLVDDQQVGDFLYCADVLDLIQLTAATLNAQQLVDQLRPLQPRQYSIASSYQAHPEEVHLLVKQVSYEFNQRVHRGVASTVLASLEAGDYLPVFIKANPGFKLPDDENARIIMIGSGTGVAPFRSFLHEREEQGLQDNSWLFFGEQHFHSDFLYQTEWQAFLKNNTLGKIDLAFSRDQQEKIYVQTRLKEKSAELYQWVQQGAYLYVCGSMQGLGEDVHQTLAEILAKESGVSLDEANNQLDELKISKRYQRDVY